MPKRAKVSARRYLVGVPIPCLDADGRALPTPDVAEWTRRAMDELTACFGGATPVPAPGTNVVQGPTGEMQTLFEEGQVLVLSACRSRAEFVKVRERLVAFAERLAGALRQEAVFILAFPSDSLLVEGVARSRRKGRRGTT